MHTPCAHLTKETFCLQGRLDLDRCWKKKTVHGQESYLRPTHDQKNFVLILSSTAGLEPCRNCVLSDF